MCLSLEPYDVERLEQLCHFTSRSELVIIWFTLPSDGPEKVTRGGEWEPIKNFSMEHGLCPELDPTRLSSSSAKTT
jgi:hypothetical protein